MEKDVAAAFSHADDGVIEYAVGDSEEAAAGDGEGGGNRGEFLSHLPGEIVVGLAYDSGYANDGVEHGVGKMGLGVRVRVRLNRRRWRRRSWRRRRRRGRGGRWLRGGFDG